MAAKKKKKADGRVPITMRAVVQRINRRLQPSDELLKRTRGANALREFGDYYQLDLHNNRILEHHVDPEALGRRLGVIREFERVVEG